MVSWGLQVPEESKEASTILNWEKEERQWSLRPDWNKGTQKPWGPFFPALGSALLSMLASFSYSIYFLHLVDIWPLSLMSYGSNKERLPFSSLQHQVKYLYNDAGRMGRWQLFCISESDHQKSQGNPIGTALLPDASLHASAGVRWVGSLRTWNRHSNQADGAGQLLGRGTWAWRTHHGFWAQE